MKQVAALVLTWNSADFIKECLVSLKRSMYPIVTYVVDNDSADNSRQIVVDDFPSLNLTNSGSNLGYAGGNNLGLLRLMEEDYDYILVLNPDATVTEGCIGKLVDRMEKDASLAGISPLITFKSSGKIWYAGSNVNWSTGETPHLGYNKVDDQTYPEEYTGRLNGCAMLLRTAALKSIGLLDENYFLYFEETDWSVRAQRAGYTLGFEQSARVEHIVSASTGSKTSKTFQYYMARNRLYFMDKFASRPLFSAFVIKRCLLSLVDIARITRANGLKAGWLVLVFRITGVRDFIFKKYGKLNESVT